MQRIAALEGLRGLLALWVVFGHVVAAAGFGANWRGPFKILASGGHAVDVFVILSGFVIFFLIDAKRETYTGFLFRRFLRIFPVYSILLAASLALMPIALGALHALPWDSPLNQARVTIIDDTMRHLPAQLLAHVTMLHGVVPGSILPSSPYAILGQAWSISLEWQFYLIAPLLFAAFERRMAVGVIVAACAVHFLVPAWEGFLPRHIPYFAVGIASYFMWRSPPRGLLPGLLCPAATALVYLLTHDPALVIWAAVFTAMLTPSAPGCGWLLRALTARATQFLGRISYSVYLSHMIALYAVMAVLVRAGVEQQMFLAVMLPTVVALTLVASTILYTYIERPFIDLGRRTALAGVPVTTA